MEDLAKPLAFGQVRRVRANSCQLYLISPPVFTLGDFARDLKDALSGGPAAAFQLRLKTADGQSPPDEEILAAARALAPIVQDAGCAFILNDRPDLAASIGADGVHIGQEDWPYARARAQMGADRIVGVTCHNSRHLAMEAAEAGADYVAFGAFFPTATKAPKSAAEPEILTWWQELFEVPCVAIGGVNAQNAPILARAGADFVAVSGSVWNGPERPGRNVAAILSALKSA